MSTEEIIESRNKACEDLADRFLQDMNTNLDMSFRENLVCSLMAATFIGQTFAPPTPNE
jgi:hypothetical protein